ncbi:MAG TPA: Re/Si-specific NAD(P)(+) transhydrogenase subunit alpha [Alphaproteobacteria bacterium]|nr:Re/Si-specific NAD(P)(+) transhydrogenase subunit alpha [Alphaproteobacteria bacterium]
MVKIGVITERALDENRVAVSPDTVRKLKALGVDVLIESGAGLNASFTDDMFLKAGAVIQPEAAAILSQIDILLKVQQPFVNLSEQVNQISLLKDQAIVIGLLSPYTQAASFPFYEAKKITSFSLELLPRTTRAQSMDVLSSQANLAGYRAVLEAADAYGRSFPMMMTAAGTIAPARLMVMGAGVAGLQAIATARRLGAIVSATDVRPAAKEQVESLGASFVAVMDEEFKAAESAAGYAKQMSQAYLEKQAALIAETIKKQDMVITTAQIPGRPAPKLITKAMVETMKYGSVIVDLAVEQGGNCELSALGQVTVHQGVKIIGYRNLPSRLAEVASSQYANNIYQFFLLLFNKSDRLVQIPWDDDIIKATTLTRDGQMVNPAFQVKK